MRLRPSRVRAPGDDQRRIFRRGYPLISGSPNGLDRGLLFISYARSISTQFEFIFRAWMRNVNFPDQAQDRMLCLPLRQPFFAAATTLFLFRR